jgi:KDO2-lipid IV(A) lauroyltransferase
MLNNFQNAHPARHPRDAASTDRIGWTDAAVYVGLKAFLAVAGRLPPGAVARVSGFLGSLLHALDGKHRRIARSNLRRAFGREMPPAEIRRLSRTVFTNLFRMMFEVAWAQTLTPARYRRYFRVEGLDCLQRAHQRGRGVLILSAHMGSWELASVVPAMAGYSASGIYRPLDYAPLDRLVREVRSQFFDRLIPNTRSMRKILQSLRAGELVGLMMDQNVDWYEGVYVDFFGHRACTNKGLALLALKTGAPVVPIFLLRADRGFRAVIGPEIPLIRTGDKIRDLEENTLRYNQVIENIIRQQPDQWFWVHQRWKTRPYYPWPRV